MPNGLRLNLWSQRYRDSGASGREEGDAMRAVIAAFPPSPRAGLA
jgi:hypothetical protein